MDDFIRTLSLQELKVPLSHRRMRGGTSGARNSLPSRLQSASSRALTSPKRFLHVHFKSQHTTARSLPFCACLRLRPEGHEAQAVTQQACGAWLTDSVAPVEMTGA